MGITRDSAVWDERRVAQRTRTVREHRSTDARPQCAVSRNSHK